MADQIAVSIDIEAPPGKVWAALTRPELIKLFMMGATVDTDWQVGDPITWSGDYKGTPFEDKGVIEAFEPEQRLSMTHWSPMSGLADVPENYHLVSYELVPSDGGTKLTLTQQNLTGVSAEQSKKNWQPMLDGLKRVAEAQ